MKNNITNYNESIFESIKHIDEYDNEFWYARELQKVLEYKRWDKFLNVIKSSKNACEGSKNNIINHFSQAGKMIDIAKGAQRIIEDYKLSRYACYLIVQNSDPRKEVVALGQTYFAIQTRKQELLEGLSEDYGITHLKYMRQFYSVFQKSHPLGD